MRLTAAECVWLERFAMVDPEVDLARVRLHSGGPVGLYLKLTKHGAVTVGNHIFFRTADRRRRTDLVVHELVHVGQFKRIGFFTFLRRYILEQLRRRGYSHEHTFEAPAYARQDQARTILREHGQAGP